MCEIIKEGNAYFGRYLIVTVPREQCCFVGVVCYLQLAAVASTYTTTTTATPTTTPMATASPSGVIDNHHTSNSRTVASMCPGCEDSGTTAMPGYGSHINTNSNVLQLSVGEWAKVSDSLRVLPSVQNLIVCKIYISNIENGDFLRY